MLENINTRLEFLRHYFVYVEFKKGNLREANAGSHTEVKRSAMACIALQKFTFVEFKESKYSLEFLFLFFQEKRKE